MQIVWFLLLNGLAVFVTAYVLPGVSVDSFLTAIIVGLALGIINALVRPVLVLLTLPITIATLGLFYLVINAGLILLVSAIVPGFTVANFWWALLFGLVMSIVSWFLNSVVGVAKE